MDYIEANSIPVTETGCWLWLRTTNEQGYGRLYVNGVRVYAHRLAYELSKGSIAEGLVVRHKCDTPSCCNPEHLVLGTRAQNANDRDRRGRGRWLHNEERPTIRYSNAVIIAIRSAVGSTRQIARALGVSKSFAHAVRTNKVRRGI